MLPALNALGNFCFQGWLSIQRVDVLVSTDVADQPGVVRGFEKKSASPVLWQGTCISLQCDMHHRMPPWLNLTLLWIWLSWVMWLLLLPWAGEDRDGRSVFSLGYVWNFFLLTNRSWIRNLQNKNFMLEWKIHKYILGLVTDFFSFWGYKVSRAKCLFIRHGKKMLLWLQILNGCRRGAFVHAVIESQHNNMPAWENSNMQQEK